MSTLYTNLPYTNQSPDLMRNDLNMISNIKIKLLRAGMFSNDSLSRITLGSRYILKGIDIGVDRAIHILSTINNSNKMMEFKEIATVWAQYVLNQFNTYRHLLTPMEQDFVIKRISHYSSLPLFATLESYGPGEYVIRV